MAQQKFRIGQRVYWNDPDTEWSCSGWYRVREISVVAQRLGRITYMYGISPINNTEGSTAAFEYELTTVPYLGLRYPSFFQRNMTTYWHSYYRSIKSGRRRIDMLRKHRRWHRSESLLRKFFIN